MATNRHLHTSQRVFCGPRAARSMAACTLACCLLFIGGAKSHAGTTSDILNSALVLPGMTQTIEVIQAGRFPLGCPHFLILVLGSGTLGISLKNESEAAETVFMLGLAHTGAATVPIARLGSSGGMIDQIIEIGSSCCFVWLYCGVALAELEPAYLYDVRLSLAP